MDRSGRGGNSRVRKPRTLHPCPQCGKAFTKRSNMLIHSRLHTGETPYVCKYAGCGRSYKWLSSINFHESRCDKRSAGLADPPPRPPPPPAAAEASRVAALRSAALAAAAAGVPTTSTLPSSSIGSIAGPSSLNLSQDPSSSHFPLYQSNIPSDFPLSAPQPLTSSVSPHYSQNPIQHSSQHGSHQYSVPHPSQQSQLAPSQLTGSVPALHPPLSQHPYQSLPSYQSLQLSAQRRQSGSSAEHGPRHLLHPPSTQSMQHLQHSGADFSAPISHNINTAQYQVHAPIHQQRNRPYDTMQGGSHVSQMQHPQQTQHFQSVPESTAQLQLRNELMSQHSGGGSYMSNQLRSEDTRSRSGTNRLYHLPTEDPLQYLQPSLSMGHPSMGTAGSSGMGPPTSMHSTRESGASYQISGSSAPEQGYTQGSSTTVSPPAPPSNLTGEFTTSLIPAMARQSFGPIGGRWGGSTVGQAPLRSGRSPTRATLSPSRNSMISPVTPLRSLNGETAVAYAGVAPGGAFSISEMKQGPTAVGLAPNPYIAPIGLQCKRAVVKKQHFEINTGQHISHNVHPSAKIEPKCENVDETRLNRSGDLDKKEATSENVGNVTTETGVSGFNGSDCGNSGTTNGIDNRATNGDGNVVWGKNGGGLNSTVSSPSGRQWNEHMFANGLVTGIVQYDNDRANNGASRAGNDLGNGVYRFNANDGYNGQSNGLPVGDERVGNQVDCEGPDGKALRDKHIDKQNGETQH